MTDDDINLPPLPREMACGLCGATLTDAGGAALRAYARAAVEADRARRAAPPAPSATRTPAERAADKAAMAAVSQMSLSAPSAEPVAWLYTTRDPRTARQDQFAAIDWTPSVNDPRELVNRSPLYTAPPAHREAMRMALEALDDALWFVDGGSGGPDPAIASKARKAINALTKALGEE